MPMTDISGQNRFAVGSLRYPSPPELGTIVGPHPITREWLAVLGTDADGRTWLGPATKDELAAVGVADEPRSVTEYAVKGGR